MKTFKEWKFDMLGKRVWLRPGMVMYGDLEVVIPENTYGQIVAKYTGITNQCFAIATDEPLEINSKIEDTLKFVSADRIIWLNSRKEDGPKNGGWFPDIHFVVL
jgi:hypothetical protein